MDCCRRTFVSGFACFSAATAYPLRTIAQVAPNGTDADAEIPCSTLLLPENDFQIIDFSPSELASLQGFQITDYGTFVLSKRWRRDDGLTPNSNVITLGCAFLNGSNSQQRRVAETAMQWLDGPLSNFIDLRFGVPPADAQIRIFLGGGRNNSAVGRDSLRISPPSPTMNLGNFRRSSTVLHEFGHAFGLRHEHRFPGAIEFNDAVVLEEMARQDWSPAQTYANILNALDENARCIGDPSLNPESIMMYPIPARWTVDGRSFRRAGHITERDIRCLVGVYSQ